VYDQSGMKMGIGVGVNVKHKKVMNVWGIMDRTYAKSDYAGVTDAAAIKDYIAKLDNYPIAIDAMPRGTTVKKATVTLGEPTLSYSLFYKYDQNVTQELVVPSLIFPVTKVDGGDPNSYYRQTVVVPLAKDLLVTQDNGMRPMMEQ
jgi:hypothetical protein